MLCKEKLTTVNVSAKKLGITANFTLFLFIYNLVIFSGTSKLSLINTCYNWSFLVKYFCFFGFFFGKGLCCESLLSLAAKNRLRT